MSFNVNRVAVVSLLAATLSPCTLALAQDTSGGRLEEIVVTAQKRAERLQDVPISVSVVDAAELTGAGIDSSTNLAQVTPGLLSNQLAGYQHYFIRGIGSDYSQIGVNQSVATYVDGVVIQNSGGVNQSLMDVERVEVLKGPQGTLYGRNATGGAVNVITRKPTEDLQLETSIGAGNFDRKNARAFLAGPIGGGFKASIAGIYDKHESYNDNIGPEYADPFTKGGRGKLVYGTDDGLEATLTAFYMKIRYAGDGGFAQTQPNSVGAFLGGLNADADGTNKFHTLSNDFTPPDRYTQKGGSLTLRAPFAAFDLVSITGYTHYRQRAGADFDATTAPIAFFDTFDTMDDTTTQELQLVSNDASSRHQWVGGVYYFHNKAGYPRHAPLITPDGLGGTTELVSTAKSDSYAIYGQDKISLNDMWSLTLGARLGRDEIDFGGFSLNGAPKAQADKPSWTNFSPKVTLDWKHDNLMVYGTLTSGYKAGSFNLTSSADVGPVDPEKVYGVELGIKSDINAWARVEAAAYGYRYKDLQISFIPNNTNPTILTNADEAEIIGLELGWVIAPIAGLEINGGLSWLARAKYTDYDNGTAYIDNSTFAPGAPGYSVVGPVDFTDNRMQRTPKVSGNLGASYSWTLPFGSLDLAGNVYRSGKYYFSAQNVSFADQSAYTLLNASIGLTSSDKHWSIVAAGQNLTDKNYYNEISPNQLGAIANYGAPRTYSVTLGYKY